MNDFLPAGYEVPQAPSGYLKFADGLNQIRILSSAITGFEYFTDENKPVRSREAFEEAPANLKEGGKVKPFWAFIVWNYSAKSIQILELTQKSIMTAIKALVDNPKWGNPIGRYDIAITKTGKSLETEYNVQGEPPINETDGEIRTALEKKKINLEALFTGENPFIE